MNDKEYNGDYLGCEFITQSEAARRLGVCRQTIGWAMHNGLYETIVLGKRTLLVWDKGTLRIRR